MNLLLVLVSALVLVAHGKVLSQDEVASNNAAKYEQEGILEDGGIPQGVYAVEDAGDSAVGSNFFVVEDDSDPQLFETKAEQAIRFQESPQTYDLDSPAVEPLADAKGADSIYIPILIKSCTNPACAYICFLLGFKNGICVSASTCQCYN